MRYRPVYIAEVVSFTFPEGFLQKPGNRRLTHDQHYKYATKVETYWQACGRKKDSCGHKHRTEGAAEPCLRKMKKAWTAMRSRVSREAAARRRAIEKYVNQSTAGHDRDPGGNRYTPLIPR